MQKSATLNLRVDPEVKRSAESTLLRLGLSMSTAVDLFLRQVALTGGIPFRIALPEAPAAVDADRMSDEELLDHVMRGVAQADAGDMLSLDEMREMLAIS